MFELCPTKKFSKEIKKLQKSEIERISRKLELAAEQPMVFFEKLEGFNLYKTRVGKFRVISSINFQLKKITLLSVGLRKNIYKKL
ncbi:MAG: hypothetical protein Q7R70_07005 [Candidatus Diapherotrites archaeon]|nr:hypothetical protein [Candidatus Diapherotrites archaeon]